MSVVAEFVIHFHCGYARKMAVEPLKLKQLFYCVTFGSCFVALSVLQKVRIGPVHGMTSCMIGTVESMNLRPVMASIYGQNDVSSNSGI